MLRAPPATIHIIYLCKIYSIDRIVIGYFFRSRQAVLESSGKERPVTLGGFQQCCKFVKYLTLILTSSGISSHIEQMTQ